MSRAIFMLRGGASGAMDEMAAVDCLELIVGLSTPAPKHPPLLAALKRLIALGADSMPQVAALADWWGLVAAGQRSDGHAWQLPDGLDPKLRAFLERTRDRSGDEHGKPLLQRIIQRRLFKDALASLGKSLEYSDTETSKFPGEENAWEELIQELRQAAASLVADRPVPHLPEIEDGAARRVMKKYGVRTGSPRWKYFLRRVEDARRCRDRLAELRDGLDETPPDISISSEEWVLPRSGTPVARAVTSVLGPLLRKPDELTAATAARLEDLAATADQPGLEWLACLGEPWSRHTGVTIEPFAGPLRRYREAVAQAGRLRSQGFDTDLALLLLEEANLSEAEAALADQEGRRRASERRKSLESQIASLRKEIEGEEEELFDEVRAELDAIEPDLSDSTVDMAYERFHVVSRHVETARREAHIKELEDICAAFTRLGSRPNAAEMSNLLQDIRTDPDKPLPYDQIHEARGRIEQIREELERRAGLLRDETRRRAENAREDLEASARTSIEALLESSNRASQADDPLKAEAEAQRAREVLDRFIVPEWTAGDGESALVDHVTAFVRASAGFSERDVRRIHVALKTRRFVVLSGLTGSGKSTMVRLFAEAFHATSENGRFLRVAVRPNWVDPSEVLGYLNPMTNRFEPGWMATLMRACERDPNLPFFCLLDEMNLAPVEQYLADILSAMEEAFVSRLPVPVQLYSPGAEPVNAADWPSAIPFPGNLFLFGTINIDESTRGLSDRVLDRANVVQLSVEIGREHHSPKPAEPRVERRRVRMRDWISICATQGTDRCHDMLVEVAEVFAQMRIGLGVRSHFEIERFLANAVNVLEDDEALDLALLQRAVPKIRGFKRDLVAGLTRFRELAEKHGAERTVSVLDDWLDGSTGDDAYIDGTDARVGLVTSY